MQTLPPTTKHRRGRRTPRQERALANPGPALVVLDELAEAPPVRGNRPLVLDIGFGAGEAIMALAAADPGTDILAVDMHTPGIGDLLASISEADITNVYVVDGDVRQLLDKLPDGRLSGVRTFFPDPWPKKRHHKRRLINAAFAAVLADKVDAGGYWHIATDWGEYADAIEQALAHSQAWRGGRIPRPDWRPQTRYERRGLAADRSPIDLWFERVDE
jgi:tRNA (guanine-N7-)-methyltransferase